jgi:hypothetical protein
MGFKQPAPAAPPPSHGGGFGSMAQRAQHINVAFLQSAVRPAPIPSHIMVNPMLAAPAMGPHLAESAKAQIAANPLPAPPPVGPLDMSGGGGGGGGSPPPADAPPPAPEPAPEDQASQDEGQQPPPPDEPQQIQGTYPLYDDGEQIAVMGPPPEDDGGGIEQPEGVTPPVADPSNSGEGDGFYGDVRFPLVASHIVDNQLRTYALMQCADGVRPMTSCVNVPVQMKDGYVVFGCDTGIFGLDVAIHKTKVTLMKRAEKEKAKLECESLVRRARQGDQNAMALISQTAENAKKGDPRARFSYACIGQYIHAHPNDSAFGEEHNSDLELTFWSTVALANGAPLTTQRIGNMAASFKDPTHKRLFLTGVTQFKNKARMADIARHLDTDGRTALHLGRTVGEGRALQQVRRGAPLKTLDANMGWEMGE